MGDAFLSSVCGAPGPARAERLRLAMRRAGCETALLVGAKPVAYLAGYHRYGSGPAALLIDRGVTTLLVPDYEIAVASANSSVDQVQGFGTEGVGLEPDLLLSLKSAAGARLRSNQVAFVDDDGATARRAIAAAGATGLYIGATLRSIRMVKDADELERIARANQLCRFAQLALEADVAPGRREIEMFETAHGTALLEAGEPIEFIADVLVGGRSSLVCAPMAVSGATPVACEDVMISDISVRWRGYWGDTTRTYVAGENPEAEAVRARLTEIEREIAQRLVPGTSASDVHATIRSAVTKAFPSGRFPHHAGHGIGLDPAEAPRLVPGDTTPLATGMVLALEPGVYFEGRFGVRVEDAFVVTPRGGVSLSPEAPTVEG